MAENESITERQQMAAERIMEDEGLTSDLTDDQAAPLVQWASSQATRIAGDPANADATVDEALKAIRRAVLRVAYNAADEHNPDRLVQLAQQELAQMLPDLAAPSGANPTSEAPTPDSAADNAPAGPSTASSSFGRRRRLPSLWQRLRRWRNGK